MHIGARQHCAYIRCISSNSWVERWLKCRCCGESICLPVHNYHAKFLATLVHLSVQRLVYSTICLFVCLCRLWGCLIWFMCTLAAWSLPFMPPRFTLWPRFEPSLSFIHSATANWAKLSFLAFLVAMLKG